MDSQPTSTLKLVLTDGPVGQAEIPDVEVELGFRFDELLALNPQIQVSDRLMSEHLAHGVAAAPGNLLRHAQRIFFFIGSKDSDGLFSSLLDLFIALDGKGAPLRRRLLDLSRERLSPENFGILSHWLENGPPPGEDIFSKAGQSVLSRGITGVRELIKVFHSEGESQRDPIIEAREHIEYFQLEQARELLEAAILAQPGREELHVELAHLYQATRDAARLQAMREKLSQIMPRLPECWLKPGENMPPRGGESQ